MWPGAPFSKTSLHVINKIYWMGPTTGVICLVQISNMTKKNLNGILANFLVNQMNGLGSEYQINSPGSGFESETPLYGYTLSLPMSYRGS